MVGDRLNEFRKLLVTAGGNWSSDGVPRYAAAFSFYAILSLAPLLVLVVVVGGAYLGNNAQARSELLHQAQGFFGKNGAEFISTLVENATNRNAGIFATVVSFVVTFVGASNLFLQLNDAVNGIWKVRQEGSVLKILFLSRVGAFFGVLSFGALAVAWLVLDSWISWARRNIGLHGSWQEINLAISFLFLLAVFGIAFKTMPRGRVGWGDVWLASVLTSLGITGSKYLLGLYFAKSGVASAYGPAGALVVILLWFYYTSQIYFFGVELTRVYAQQMGSLSGERMSDE